MQPGSKVQAAPCEDGARGGRKATAHPAVHAGRAQGQARAREQRHGGTYIHSRWLLAPPYGPSHDLAPQLITWRATPTNNTPHTPPPTTQPARPGPRSSSPPDPPRAHPARAPDECTARPLRPRRAPSWRQAARACCWRPRGRAARARCRWARCPTPCQAPLRLEGMRVWCQAWPPRGRCRLRRPHFWGHWGRHWPPGWLWPVEHAGASGDDDED